LLGGIVLIYALLNLLLVRGFAYSADVTDLKDAFNEIFGNQGELASSLGVFFLLASSSGSGGTVSAGAYQTVLLLVVSLAVIWALRQSLTGIQVRIRDAFYRGMYPLVPFVLVLCVIGVQLVPLLIGAQLYSLAIGGGVAVLVVEKVLWGLLFFLLALWSLYMVSSSLFALYIVTLPDMTPMKALRSAQELVRYRRWTVLRKVLFLPFLLVVGAAVIMVPIIALAAPVAEWVFFALSLLGLVATHAYLYNLYRELL
jgi:hypothetical protein